MNDSTVEQVGAKTGGNGGQTGTLGGISAPRGRLAPPWQPGQSGNPSGRPKVGRSVAAALAELQDTPGETPEASVEAYKLARGAKLCGADHRAIALHLQACDRSSRLQVAAADSYADRVEGRVIVRSEVTGAEGVPLFRPINLPSLPPTGVFDAEVIEGGDDEG